MSDTATLALLLVRSVGVPQRGVSAGKCCTPRGIHSYRAFIVTYPCPNYPARPDWWPCLHVDDDDTTGQQERMRSFEQEAEELLDEAGTSDTGQQQHSSF